MVVERVRPRSIDVCKSKEDEMNDTEASHTFKTSPFDSGRSIEMSLEIMADICY